MWVISTTKDNQTRRRRSFVDVAAETRSEAGDTQVSSLTRQDHKTSVADACPPGPEDRADPVERLRVEQAYLPVLPTGPHEDRVGVASPGLQWPFSPIARRPAGWVGPCLLVGRRDALHGAPGAGSAVCPDLVGVHADGSKELIMLPPGTGSPPGRRTLLSGPARRLGKTGSLWFSRRWFSQVRRTAGTWLVSGVIRPLRPLVRAAEVCTGTEFDVCALQRGGFEDPQACSHGDKAAVHGLAVLFRRPAQAPRPGVDLTAGTTSAWMRMAFTRSYTVTVTSWVSSPARPRAPRCSAGSGTPRTPHPVSGTVSPGPSSSSATSGPRRTFREHVLRERAIFAHQLEGQQAARLRVVPRWSPYGMIW